EQFRSKMTAENDHFYRKRREQTVQTMYESINQQLSDRFYGNEEVQSRLIKLEKDVLAGKISAYQAAAELLSLV
ncbi:MAG TPA: hypothetical protein VK994_06325, partial [Bacteroidales bacterium]|nr:hypothetical protein [Bacteroidales bacterium]